MSRPRSVWRRRRRAWRWATSTSSTSTGRRSARFAKRGCCRFLRRVATPYVVASGAAFRPARRDVHRSVRATGWSRAAVTDGHETTHNAEIRRKSEQSPRNGWADGAVRMGPAKGPNGYTIEHSGNRSLTVALTAGRPRSDGFAATSVVEESPDPVRGRLPAAAAGGDRGDHRRGGRRRPRSGPRRAGRDRRGRRQRAGGRRSPTIRRCCKSWPASTACAAWSRIRPQTHSTSSAGRTPISTASFSWIRKRTWSPAPGSIRRSFNSIPHSSMPSIGRSSSANRASPMP